MKKCPTCDKEFPDSMRFCQTDGTVLVDVAPPDDPYKTVVGNQGDIAAAIPPLDPFKTMVASSPLRVEEDLLQLPDEQDNLKTMVVSYEEMREELKSADVPPLDLPQSASPVVPSAPLIEPKPPAPPPSFGDAGNEPSFPKPLEPVPNAVSPAPPSPFDSKPFDNDFSAASPYGNQENKPIPSPFQDSMPPSYQPPSVSPFDTPSPMKEVESPFGGQPDAPNQSAFQPPTPFGQPDLGNAPIQQTGWGAPPPAPVSGWGNQELGTSAPFQPSPAAGGGSLDQTLPIISLVLGILSLCCYVSPLTGLAALVTGYLGMQNANTDPSKYGGKTLAIIGMALGGVFFLVGVLYYILVVILGVAGSF